MHCCATNIVWENKIQQTLQTLRKGRNIAYVKPKGFYCIHRRGLMRGIFRPVLFAEATFTKAEKRPGKQGRGGEGVFPFSNYF